MARTLIGIACLAAFAIAGCRDPDYHGRHHHNPAPSPVIVHHPASGGHSGSIRPPKPPKDKHKKPPKVKPKSGKPPKNPPKASPKPPAPKQPVPPPKQPQPPKKPHKK